MEDKRCFVCKYTDRPQVGVSTATFYTKTNAVVPLLFCTTHSVEFFKMGQKKFFEQYGDVFRASYGSESDERILRTIGLR